MLMPATQEALCSEIMENKDTAMLAQHIKNLGRNEGMLFEAKDMVTSALGVKFPREPEAVPTACGPFPAEMC
jgi:hypothetical protein